MCACVLLGKELASLKVRLVRVCACVPTVFFSFALGVRRARRRTLLLACVRCWLDFEWPFLHFPDGEVKFFLVCSAGFVGKVARKWEK